MSVKIDRFIDYLEIVTRSNYSVTAKSHTLQFTNSHNKFFQSAVLSLIVAW
jgi:hypothetical protein